MLDILGYSLALLMGLTLGMIGAGGSILTVPILVYLLSVNPIIATGYSLLVVGVTALIGAISYTRLGKVNFNAAIKFALPAMLMVLLTRSYIIPALPEIIFQYQGVGITREFIIMIFFSGLMLSAASLMLKPITINPQQNTSKANNVSLVLGSAGVGLLTGLVGAGGGFLIIPTLIFLFKLEMDEAIGTSLAIIAINSLVGFKGDLSANIPMDWSLLVLFISLTVSGMLIGSVLGRKVDRHTLKKGFAIFTLTVAMIMLVEEFAHLIEQYHILLT